MILIKVIPDKIFHILWSYASKCKDLNEYILHFTSIKSKGYIDFYRECNINESDIIVHAKWNITIIYDKDGYLVSEKFETINSHKDPKSQTCYGEANYEFM